MNQIHRSSASSHSERPFYALIRTRGARLSLVLLIVGWLIAMGSLHTSVLAYPPAQERIDFSDREQVVMRVHAPNPTTTQLLTEMPIDLLEMRDGADLFAIVTPAQLNSLQAAGWHARVDVEQTDMLLPRQPVRPQTFLGGYRTVEQIEEILQTRATQYPDLVTLQDFGDSWEKQQAPDAGVGYDLWAMRLTNKAAPGPKPVFMLLAAVHAREISTPEVAVRFIDHLLQNYGLDAEVTWLLNEYEIVVTPMLNPDGYKFAEDGYLQRKNTNDTRGVCNEPPDASSQYGVDLNRNFELGWGIWDKPTMSPCGLTYPGPTPASEPETQAIQNLVRELFPGERPRPANGIPVPADTSGVLITMHSFSDLILWPWGNTYTTAPDHETLRQLGERMAAFNSYTPSQAIYLYPTSGTTDDWSYGELGIASYTFEIGPISGECAGFFPPYSCMDDGSGGFFWQRNLPALLYAARVSRAPYSLPAGPDPAVQVVEVLDEGDTISLVLTIDGGSEPIEAATLYLGASPAHGSTPIALQPLTSVPTSGALQQQTPTIQNWLATIPAEQFTAVCSTNAAAVCRDYSGEQLPLLLVQAQNTAGLGGPLRPVWPEGNTTTPPTTAQQWIPLVQQQ